MIPRILLLLLLSACCPYAAAYYRVGEPVDTHIFVKGKDEEEALRAQMPKFGISNRVEFPQLASVDAFTLGFEEGLWNLPWYYLPDGSKRSGQPLETLVVQFVYAGGMIHSVSAQPKYSKSESKGYQGPISVEYEWVAQESVQILAGASVMFLATIIVSVVFLFQACGISDDDEDGVQSNGHSHHETTTPNFMGVPIGLDASGAGGVPKYD